MNANSRTDEFYLDLQEKLDRMPLIDSDGIIMELTALDALNLYEPHFKRGKTQKYSAFYYRKGLCKAIAYVEPDIDDSMAESVLFELVSRRAPKLDEKQHAALALVQKKARENGVLSRLYYSPPICKEVRQFVSYLQRHARLAPIAERPELRNAAKELRRALDEHVPFGSRRKKRKLKE